jgi:hypothetical protein
MKKIINEIKYFFTRNIEHLDLPFPLFEVIEDEALLLQMAYGKIILGDHYLCRILSRLNDSFADSKFSLRNKIYLSLTTSIELSDQIGETYTDVWKLNMADLRKVWVRKLLEHNGFSTEGLK